MSEPRRCPAARGRPLPRPRGPALLLWLLAATAVAAEPSADRILALPADPAYGAWLAGECLACHRPAGTTGGIPRIAGLDPEVFLARLLAFRSGEREHAQMQMIASRLGDAELAALARHFGALAAD